MQGSSFTSGSMRSADKLPLVRDAAGRRVLYVRLSLLEADVDFHVTKKFLARVKEKAVGETPGPCEQRDSIHRRVRPSSII